MQVHQVTTTLLKRSCADNCRLDNYSHEKDYVRNIPIVEVYTSLKTSG